MPNNIMPSILDRINQLFQPQQMMGNDLPQQGGFGGNMTGYGGIDPNQDQQPVMGDGMPPPPMQNPNILNRMAPQQSFQDDSGQDLSGMNPMGPPPSSNVANMYNQIYTPQHSASDAYNAMLARYPQHENPGFMRRLSASLVGAGGTPEDLKMSQGILDDPFNEKVADWKNQIIPMGNAANLERYTNANERQLAAQETNRTLQEQKQAETARKNQDDAAIKRARIAFNYYKQSHPNSTFKSDDEGNVIALNPQTNQVEYVTDAEGDPVNTGKLGDLQKAEVVQKNRMAQIGAQQKGAMDRTVAAGSEYIEVDDPAHPGQKMLVKGNPRGTQPPAPVTDVGGQPVTGANKIGTPKSTTGAGGKTSEFQDAEGRYNRTVKILNTDPRAKDWLKLNGKEPVIDPNGNYDDADPATQAYVKSLRDQIFGNGSTTTHMVGPDGKGYNVPNEKVNLFKTNGYQVK